MSRVVACAPDLLIDLHAGGSSNYQKTTVFCDRQCIQKVGRHNTAEQWSTKGDGSFALVGVPFYVDGTRGEAPQDAMEWIIDASLPAASLFALCVVVYTVGVALGLPPY